MSDIQDKLRAELHTARATANDIIINWYSGVITDREAICAFVTLILGNR